MKNIKFLLLSAFILIAAAVSAQTMEDVVYLKNGSIYRGTIIEQVPGESYKIQIRGGTVFSVTVTEVQKITKEAVPVETSSHNTYSNDAMGYGWPRSMRDTSKTPAYMKKNRFFGTLEFRPGINNIGLRFLRGYKFNQFASLGLGFGFDGVYMGSGISFGKGIYNNQNINDGLYIPVYLQLSGDIRKSRITPYYFIEAGYAFHPQNPFVEKNPTDRSWGGPMGTAGMGVKFHSKGRVSMALNVNANYRSNFSRSTLSYIDINGNTVSTSTNNFKGKVFGSLGLVLGF
jgi:opacity protein-like surface antigen